MAAQNATDKTVDDNVDNAGLPKPQEGKVLIQAITNDDLHLGDERVIYGRGDGEHGKTDPDTGEAFAFPSKARVTAEVAKDLIDAKKAKRA